VDVVHVLLFRRTPKQAWEIIAESETSLELTMHHLGKRGSGDYWATTRKRLAKAVAEEGEQVKGMELARVW
jgi:hypothetical protein